MSASFRDCARLRLISDEKVRPSSVRVESRRPNVRDCRRESRTRVKVQNAMNRRRPSCVIKRHPAHE